jgi:hypothetical protein
MKVDFIFNYSVWFVFKANIWSILEVRKSLEWWISLHSGIWHWMVWCVQSDFNVFNSDVFPVLSHILHFRFTRGVTVIFWSVGWAWRTSRKASVKFCSYSRWFVFVGLGQRGRPLITYDNTWWAATRNWRYFCWHLSWLHKECWGCVLQVFVSVSEMLGPVWKCGIWTSKGCKNCSNVELCLEGTAVLLYVLLSSHSLGTNILRGPAASSCMMVPTLVPVYWAVQCNILVD